jgi:hypothetical protein
MQAMANLAAILVVAAVDAVVMTEHKSVVAVATDR